MSNKRDNNALEPTVPDSARTTNGLESIALAALQSLQHGENGATKGSKKENQEPTNAMTSTSLVAQRQTGTEMTALPPPLPSMDLTARVVSADDMAGKDIKGDSVTASSTVNNNSSLVPSLSTFTKPSFHPPSVKNTHSPSSSRNPDLICVTSVGNDATEIVSSSTAQSDTTLKDNMTSAIACSDFSRIIADPEGWLRQTQNLFGKLPPVDRNPNDNIIVQPNDVLCGRGGETNHHPGNVEYRSLVKAYQKLYLEASRRDKPKIAQCIVVSVRGIGGRFLKRVKASTLRPGGAASTWVDVGNVKAREKTSQALREGAPDLRENTASTTATVATIINNNNNNVVGRGQVLPPNPRANTNSVAPTALEAMMGWFKNSTNDSRNTNGSDSLIPIVSSSNLSSDITTADDFTIKTFTAAATKLLQHSIFQQLTPAEQQEAILHEWNAARAAASAAKAAKGGAAKPSTTSCIDGKERMLTQTSSASPQHPHQQRYHSHEHPYYQRDPYYHYYPPYGHYPQDANNNNGKTAYPSTTNTTASPYGTGDVGASTPSSQTGGKVNLQSVYHEILAAKAAVSSGNAPTDVSKVNLKKRPAPSSSPSISPAPIVTSPAMTSSPTVVSDTGSEASSSSSSSLSNNCDAMPSSSSSSSIDINKNKNETKKDVSVSSSTGGPRLKRFKMRLQDADN